MGFFRKLFLLDDGERAETAELKEKVIESKRENIKDLKNINRRLKLLIDEGSVELVIKNVKGVVEENGGD